METLNQMLAYAKDHLRILIDNPGSSVKRKKMVKSGIAIPTKDQFRAILNELRDGHKATCEAADFVEFLGYSGCRQAETWDLRWRDVNTMLSASDFQDRLEKLTRLANGDLKPEIRH